MKTTKLTAQDMINEPNPTDDLPVTRVPLDQHTIRVHMGMSVTRFAFDSIMDAEDAILGLSASTDVDMIVLHRKGTPATDVTRGRGGEIRYTFTGES